MAEGRPDIPAAIKRKLIIECGHRCACCGERIALENAHIEAWNKTKEHKFENLLVLCAVCHKQSEDQKWDRLTLLEYKRNPWVNRYRSQSDGAPRAIAEFQLDLAPEKFGSEERERFIA